jgi:hypothetical protein
LPDGATQLLADLVARRRQIVEMMGAEGQRERGCHRAQEPALSTSKLRGACLCASTEASQGRAYAKRSGCACRKLDPDVMMVQSDEDRQRQNAPYRLDRPRQR